MIFKCTKHYNHLQTQLHLIQTNLQASKILITHLYRHKMIIKTWINLKLFITVTLQRRFLKFFCQNIVGIVQDVIVPNAAKRPQLLFIFVIFLSH